MKKSVILIGFKASGKTSVGRLLAQNLRCHFIDTDRNLEARYQRETGEDLSCPDIYRSQGAVRFRDLETQVINELAVSEPTVIATGGGVGMNLHCVTHLRQMGRIIYLSASQATLLTRLQANPQPAVLAGDLEREFQQMYALRAPLYQQHADWVVDTEQKSVAEIVLDLQLLLE